MLPVGGGEEHITMYSLDFEEFLLATGVKQKDIDRVRESLIKRERLSDVDVDVFSRRFYAFMVVGGMPDAVKGFVEGGMSEAERALESIRETCINDINRYNKGIDVVKTQQCFESISNQLSSTNKRFTYSRIDGGGSRGSGEKYMENLLWIMAAGYGNYCRSMTDLRQPVGRFVTKDVFKVYMSDTGMLMNMMGPESRVAIMMGDTAFDFGAVTENAVAEALMKSGYKLYYYRKSNGTDKMELDMVIESDGLVAVEVKRGKHRNYPSLKKTLGNDNVKRRVIFEKGNVFTDEQGIEHYPLFASAFIFQLKGDDHMDQLMDDIVGDPYS
ncbi:MAG: ATP-binding protein [Thermoplasmata archaeon]|nr:ATP-binding protein [Thermoplasmata archaeon]